MIKVCEMCNQEFEAKSNHGIYCTECKKKRKKEDGVQSGARWSAPKNERKPMLKPKVSIEEQNRKALAAGMTYGQYVAKYGEV